MTKNSTWYVYVISTCSGFYKIGISQQPYSRHAQLLPGIPESSNVQLMVKCHNKSMASDLEREIHKDLADYNTIGEWFKVPKLVMAELFFDLGVKTRMMDLKPPELSYYDEPLFDLAQRYFPRERK